EPLLHFSFIKSITEYAEEAAIKHDKTVDFDLTTNGTLLDEVMLWFFSTHKVKILLSIDGRKSTHDLHRKDSFGKGTFERIFAKILMIESYRPWLGVRMTVCPDTVPQLIDNVEFLFSHGINQFIIEPVSGMTWDKNALLKLEMQRKKIAQFYLQCRKQDLPIRMTVFEEDLSTLKKLYCSLWGCAGGRTLLAVAPCGDLYPCSRFLSMSNGNNGIGVYKLGNVYEGITETRLRYDFIDVRTNIHGSCLRCEYQEVCDGGCPALNYETNKTIYMPSQEECATRKMKFRLLAEMPEVTKVHMGAKQEKQEVVKCEI
ncbi:MAG: radical SAM protein, partial [bacterium]|nr:radical SAM protein [bacterium]